MTPPPDFIQPSVGSARSADVPAAHKAGGGVKLLVVDDEAEVTDYLKSFFERQGLDVLTAGTGEKGLTLLQSEQPSVALLDLRLGEGLSGMEVLRRAKAAKTPTQIVVVTAVEDRHVAEMALGLGASDYIVKPFILQDLERVVLARLKS